MAAKRRLENSTEERRSKHKALYDTVVNHFNGFLRYLNETQPEVCPYEEYDPRTIPKEFYTQSVYAMFCDYVMKEIPRVKKQQTAAGYISRMKNKLCRDYEDPDLIADQWHTDVLRDVSTYYTQACAESGERLVDSAPPATEDDVEILCTLLFNKNTPAAI